MIGKAILGWYLLSTDFFGRVTKWMWRFFMLIAFNSLLWWVLHIDQAGIQNQLKLWSQNLGI